MSRRGGLWGLGRYVGRPLVGIQEDLIMGVIPLPHSSGVQGIQGTPYPEIQRLRKTTTKWGDPEVPKGVKRGYPIN